MNDESLYTRLGGYDGITGFANNLLPRLQADPQLGRFWQHRGSDGIAREKQLLIDFISSNAGGPVYYTGRDMKLSHTGMNISDDDWNVFLSHAGETMTDLNIPKRECDDVVAFVLSLKDELVGV